MAAKWSVTQEMSTVGATRIFSGGACNILDAEGNLLRNDERDMINDWLTSLNVTFFDPQIHPDTHDCEYDYQIHHPLELAARQAARLNLYEVSPRSFGGITSFEIAVDHFRAEEPMVIYYSDGTAGTDGIPAHSEKGHPLFMPWGIDTSEQAARAHYKEFRKNANNMRKYLMNYAREMNTLTVTFGEPVSSKDIVISPDRMHASDLFRAVVKAAKGERVILTFTGGAAARDELGNPRFVLPDDPPIVEMRALLDQYVDEGNALRRAIAELVNVSVFVRVVYTQQACIMALEELMRIKGMIN